MNKIRLLVISTILITYLVSCSDSSSGSSCNEDPAYDVSGEWYLNITVTGGDQMSAGTMFTAIINVEQNDNGSITGSITLEGGLTADFSGTVCGTSLFFKIKQNAPCSGTFNGEAQINNGGTTISGSYTGSDCNGKLQADISGALNIDVDPIEITDSETWSGEVIIRSRVTILQGATLTIEPGTIIKIASRDLSSEDTTIIPIVVYGSLIANGDPDNIIQFVPQSASPGVNDWGGIHILGDAELSYCFIQSAIPGIIILSRNSTIQIEYCLLAKCMDGIVNFGADHLFTNLSFIDMKFAGYYRSGDNHFDIFNYCHFEDNTYDVRIVSFRDSIYNNSINIDNSNFINSTHESFPFTGNVFDNNILITQSYGLTNVENTDGSNRLTISNSNPSQIINAGCGFEEIYSKAFFASNKSGNIKPKKEIKYYKKYNQ